MITANKQKKKTFEMAEKKCESMNGNLPIIKSQVDRFPRVSKMKFNKIIFSKVDP